jgi:hypothetical protein
MRCTQAADRPHFQWSLYSGGWVIAGDYEVLSLQVAKPLFFAFCFLHDKAFG